MANSGGFTLVELLIVIVVIAILAAMTMVAYNGLQNRAYSTKAAVIVDGYTKLIEIYRLDNGHYPLAEVGSETSTICLGNPTDYPANSVFDAGQCYTAPSSDGSGLITTSATDDLDSLLEPYTKRLPSGELPVLKFTVPPGTVGYRGVQYLVNAGSSDSVKFIYALLGRQSCARGTALYLEPLTGIDATQCETVITDGS